ncbi:MAG: aminomethyl-transferring glycine dehydrogenase subunit GcvPA [Planctomycetes bacterium]|nr:aminomethyl-transferring glycine dehydrogenase subunit GcvPA [Planctomycetota bacterium]
MPSYVQNTDADRAAMLEAVGARSLEDLFASVPPALRLRRPLATPEGLDEPRLLAHLRELGSRNRTLDDGPSFLGAGAYDHHIPTVVDHVASRPEFYTSYTPYQPEASQGLLQVGFEFQSLMARLTGLDVVNASLYDGATATVEAALMARSATGRRDVAVSRGVHPQYRAALATYLRAAGGSLREVPLEDARTDLAAARAGLGPEVAALVLQTPSFLGVIEDAAPLAAAAREAGALAVGVVDPISLGVLSPPGEWGADLACGEGQPLGCEVAFGGPYLGFIAAREEHLRRMPGRIVGQTVDREGRRGFVLTLQTREQHIRRERATSNICTNQALLALRASVYLSAMGPAGLAEVARQCVLKTRYALERLSRVPGYGVSIRAPHFKEFVLTCPRPAAEVNAALEAEGILGGHDLSRDYPELGHALLLAFTERCPRESIERLARALEGRSHR